MTTFDLAEVREFTATIDARLKQCDNGEGMVCATLEESLRHYAGLCIEFREGVRAWGRAVFTGRVIFDPEVERLVLVEGNKLLNQAVAKADHAGMMEYDHSRTPEAGCCYVMEGLQPLRSALWGLSRLMNDWITPALSISPGPRVRRHHTPEQLGAILTRLAAMPPLPADWQPDDPKQRQELENIRCRPNSWRRPFPELT